MTTGGKKKKAQVCITLLCHISTLHNYLSPNIILIMLELVQRILSETYVNIFCSQYFDVPRKRLRFALIISLLHVAKNSLHKQLIKLSTKLWSPAGENNSVILFGLTGDFHFVAISPSCPQGPRAERHFPGGHAEPYRTWCTRCHPGMWCKEGKRQI